LQKNRCYTLLAIILLLAPIFFVIPSSKAQYIEQDWIDAIEYYAQTIDENCSAEIVVAVFPSLFGHGIKDESGQEINDIVKLGVYIFNQEPLDVYDGTQTGIGKSGKDNGVLLLVALDEQQWRIEVGYGLEGDITDIESNLIAQEYLVPAFQNGDFGEGLFDTVVALGEQIPVSNQPNNLPVRGYYYYEADSSPEPTPESFWDWYAYGMPLWLIVVLAVLGVFVPIFGRSAYRRGRSGGGGAGGKW
jgi:uncharacterized membrane protein YgcG